MKEALRRAPKFLLSTAEKIEVPLTLSGKMAGGTDFLGESQELSFEHVRLEMPFRSNWRHWVMVGCM